MKLKIFSFSGESFSSDNAISVTLMSTAWQITILDRHEPLLTSMKPSNMKVVYKTDEWIKQEENFAVWKWIVEVSNSNVKIMADMLVDTDWIDEKEAENAREKAMELMAKYKNSKDKIDMEKYIEAEDMLLKSIAQLNLRDIK